MKRIQLFEFEDFQWFPKGLRICLTRYIQAFHKILDTPSTLQSLVEKGLKHSSSNRIIDLCSGSGGPMINTLEKIREIPEHNDTSLLLTDLYPDYKSAEKINVTNGPVKYRTESLNASNVGSEEKGLRTMICSMHHMPPNVARSILSDAVKERQPILVYEISDNSFPKWIWWIAFPINFITVFFITPLVRPMSWQQLVFTYLIPILPLAIAWDGAVSNARTYTLEDMDLLLADLDSVNYTWEKESIPGKGGNKLYLLGYPV